MLNKVKEILLSDNKKIENLKKYLRKNGAQIGDNVRIFDYKNTIIDCQNPHMLNIGNNVCITSGVKILTHDYSWCVISGIYGEVLGGVGKVEIGNNVFIGVNSIILKDTKVGDNVIIGAGSVVAGEIEPNSVYVGNKAKKVMTIEEYYAKKQDKALESAKAIYINYFEKFHREPPRKMFYEYLSLFINTEDELTSEERALIERTGYSHNIYEKINNLKPKFKDYDEFINFLQNNT